MPFFQNDSHAQKPADAVKVDFPDGSDITLQVHPDGPQVKDTANYLVLVQRSQRAAKHLTRIDLLLSAGTLSKEEYEAAVKDIEEVKTQAEAKALENPGEDNEYPDSDYRQHLAQLSNSYNGKPISPEEFTRAAKEQDKWLLEADIKGNAVRYLKLCVVDWDYYESKEAFDRGDSALPVTQENLERFSQDRLLIMSGSVIAYYRKKDAKGKKPPEISLNTSRTRKTARA